MFNLFKKKDSKTIEFKSPISGKAIPLSEVPDEVFAGKMLGDGLAFEPTEGVLYAPIDGEIVNIFPTKHAVGILTSGGLEILLHIGVDTVNMAGEGFESFVEAGDKVKVGQKLVSFNIDLINEKAKSAITPLLITNMDLVESVDFNYGTANKDSIVAVVALK
jgi:sugar PTS system EIIA component